MGTILVMDSATMAPAAGAIPSIVPALRVPEIAGNGALIRFTSDGGDINKAIVLFSENLRKSPEDASLMLDIALLLLLGQRRDDAYRLQAEALMRQQIFRVVGTQEQAAVPRLRVLALVAPGDFMNNAQLEFIIGDSQIGLDVLYLLPGQPLPHSLPEHDVAFCAVNESDENMPVLKRLSRILPRWPRPVLNAPEKIQFLSRDRVASLFAGSLKICAPRVSRVCGSELQSLARGEVSLGELLAGACFPILARPVGTHCGKNLERIDGKEALTSYLQGLQSAESDFFLAEYIDYRASDGLFRKYRIVLIDGTPFVCHMAVSEQWKIHYVNVGMDKDSSKRVEEARAMETFDQDFARRHGAAFAEMWERIGLDYFGIDCAELPDGRLLLFEAETAMVIHTMDSPTLYPYKKVQMEKVFAAFRAMIDRAAGRVAGVGMPLRLAS